MQIGRIGAAVVCGLLLCGSPAWAYRPYDSTDADVADDGELEIEFGWREARFESDEERATDAVFSFGIGHGREIILEGEWQHSDSNTEPSFADVGLFLKQVHRRGSLHGESGMSVASECGVLIPTRSGDSGAGGECALIASHGGSVLSFHANAALALETDHRWVNALGLIVEGPVAWRARPGLELLREDAAGEGAELSILAGAVWNWRDGLAFDVAYRHWLEPVSTPNEWRVGVTWAR